MRVIWFIALIGGIQVLWLAGCGSTIPRKINGVSFVASRDSVQDSQVGPVLELGANYAAVMPFGFLRSPKSSKIHYNTDRQWFGETVAGSRQYIRALKARGVQVMLKPQLWIWRGTFTGTLAMDNEAEWMELEQHYTSFLLTYARLAEAENVAILCIGTELEQFVNQRTEYWQQLVSEIRKVYSGKLTYAANWDEYRRVPFWESLDYIGVDAYFPLSEERDPEVSDLRAAWQPWKTALEQLSDSTQRKVLFTEYGYRSMDHTAARPWDFTGKENRINLAAQARAQEAILTEFWGEDWFAGGFVWKWFIDHEASGGPSDNRFTPQNKPAEQVIRSYYTAY